MQNHSRIGLGFVWALSIFLSLGVASGAAHAASDFVSWSRAGVRLRVKETPWSVTADSQVRMISGSSELQGTQFRLWLGYVVPGTRLTLSPGYLGTLAAGGRPFAHVAALQGVYAFENLPGEISPSFRTRIEYRTWEGPDRSPHWRLRFLGGLERTIVKWAKAIATEEVFFIPGEEEVFSENRAQAGARLAVLSDVSLDVLYQNRWLNGSDEDLMEHAAFLNLLISVGI